MRQATWDSISLLGLICLLILLGACGTSAPEATSTSSTVENAGKETPEIEMSTPTTSETPEEGEAEAAATAEVEAEMSPAVPDSGLQAVIVSGDRAGAGKPFTFDATQSSAGDAVITNYVWTLGDGTTMFGIWIEHAFSETGFYTVTLIVTDADGQTDAAAKVVEIVELDQLETPPAEGRSTLAGTNWELSNAMRGTTITLAFDEATISGKAGCNDYEATYTVADAAVGEIAIELTSVTNFSCMPEVMAQEAGYLDSLVSAHTFIYDSDSLAIETGQGTLRFIRLSN